MLNILGCQHATKNLALAVGEPFLEHLVAAELIGPHMGGDVAPEGSGVQVDVERGLAERWEAVTQGGSFLRRIGPLNETALARHYGIP